MQPSFLTARDVSSSEKRRPIRSAISWWGGWLAFVGLMVVLPVDDAHAEPLPFRASVRLGSPARPFSLEIRAEAGGDRLEIGGAKRLRETLPSANAESATVEEVALEGNVAIAVVRTKGPAGESAALLGIRKGRPAMLWSGRLDLQGDLGERRADAIEVEDRTGDGHPNVVVGKVFEPTRICGTERTLLFPRALDPRTMELRPISLRQLPEAARGAPELVAVRETPGPRGEPVLRALRFLRASSAAGVGEEPELVPSPAGLSERDASTVWMEGRGGDGRWEFVTARWDGAPFAVRALAFTPTPADPELAASLGRPKSFYVVGDDGAAFRVVLPEDPIARPGKPYWAVFPKPLTWSCYSIVLDEVLAPKGADVASVRTGLAGVSAYTELDFGGGIPALVARLESPHASQAASLLSSIGTPGVEATLEAWPRLGLKARREALRVFVGHADREPAARKGLVAAAAVPDLSESAVEALGGAGEAGVEALGEILRDPSSPAVDAAARILARRHPREAVTLLLGALAAPGGSERSDLRLSLRESVARGGTEARLDAEAWAKAGPTPEAAAAAALALAPVSEARETLEILLEAAVSTATRFEDRYRIVEAARNLPSEAALDAWLERTAKEAEEWMIRAGAMRALAERKSPLAPAVAKLGLEDPYPRVRATAAEVLSTEAGSFELLAARARDDVWPLVREASMLALASDPQATPVLLAGIADPSENVRAAAIRALAARNERSAWSAVAKRLRNDDEWPVVLSAGVAFAGKLCLAEAPAALEAVVDRALRPDPWAPDVDVAIEAIDTLAAIGGPGADAVLKKASAESAPSALREAVARARKLGKRCRSSR